ncbi:hypothetical protein ACP275_09G002500 [Erythranthe tilingii]
MDQSQVVTTSAHRFTLENYSLWRGVGYGKSICSSPFTVGGHQWAIFVFPDGAPSEKDDLSDMEEGIYFGVCLCLLSEGDGVSCLCNLKLLDQTGEGNHLTVYPVDDKADAGPVLINTGQKIGAPRLMRRYLFDRSPYVWGNSVKIECKLGILAPPETELGTPSSINAVPQNNDGPAFHFLGMLESGEGCDVTFNVGGVEFRAHKVILSARSSVFESMFFSLMAFHKLEVVLITDVEPRIFKALLHFIYCDTLPEDEMCLVEGYAFGPSVSSTFGAKLLAAADKYGVERLKSICESHLWKSISLKRLAETLMIADTCNASTLKNLCYGLAADRYTDIEKLDTFVDLEKNCPLIHKELVEYLSKQGSVATSKAMRD